MRYTTTKTLIEMKPHGNKRWQDVSKHVLAWDGQSLRLDRAIQTPVTTRNPDWRINGQEYVQAPTVEIGPGPLRVTLIPRQQAQGEEK